MPTCKLFGIDVLNLTLEETAEVCADRARRAVSTQHVGVNAAKVVLMHDDPQLARVIGECDLVSADGVSVVWASRYMGCQLKERVAGIDLMGVLLETAEREAMGVYFLGATEEVLQKFVDECRARMPRLEIRGYQHGYFDDANAVLADVRASGARMLFVGIPSPAKEHLLAGHADTLPGIFAMGVGGSFDVWAGKTRRAPMWMQHAGLEWLFRFIQEPVRMWSRYVVGNTRFVMLVITEMRRGGRGFTG